MKQIEHMEMRTSVSVPYSYSYSESESMVNEGMNTCRYLPNPEIRSESAASGEIILLCQ